MGLIVNRPSSVNVSNALKGHFQVPQSENVIYFGGPVDQQALCMLHNQSSWGDSDLEVVPDVFVGSSADTFENIIGQTDQPAVSQFRVYLGYAGWGTGQLEDEIDRGDWHTLPASAGFVFSEKPYLIWEDLLCEFHKQHRILPIPAERAEWN